MRPLAAPDPAGLRPYRNGFGGSGSEGAWVVRVDPSAGAAGVLGDAPVVVTFSRPVASHGLGHRTLRVWEDQFPVTGRLTLSPDACVVIWSPERPMRAGMEHTVEIAGLRDPRGREVQRHRSVFTVGHHTLEDLLKGPVD